MSLRSEAVFDGEIVLPIGVGRGVWLPGLSGEDARVAWTMLARGFEFGLAKIKVGDKRPRHWALHRSTLEDYARCARLTDERLAAIVEGSTILSDDPELKDVRMFEAATVRAGSWGYASGKVVVQPTAAFFAWMKDQDQTWFTIPASIWHKAGQKLAVGLCVRLYATLEQPRTKFAWKLMRDDLVKLDASLEKFKLATMTGVYLKKAIAALTGAESRYALRATTILEGRKAVGVLIEGRRMLAGRKKAGGLDGLGRQEGYVYPPELTRQAAEATKVKAYFVEKTGRNLAAAKKGRSGKLSDIGRARPAPVQPKLPFGDG